MSDQDRISYLKDDIIKKMSDSWSEGALASLRITKAALMSACDVVPAHVLSADMIRVILDDMVELVKRQK